jgi:hypothetical protein
MSKSVTDKVIRVRGDFTHVNKAIDKYRGNLKQADDAAKKQEKASVNRSAQMRKGYLAAAAAVAAIGAALKGAVQAYNIQAAAENKLGQAYKNTGDQSGVLLERSKRFAAGLQQVTTVGDETTLGLMQLGLSMGVSTDKIEQATEGAIGLSKSLKIDMNAAMKLSALATAGNYSMLARYIPALKMANSDAEKAAIVQKAMADGMAIAQAETETYEGKMKQLSNSWGDFQENIGESVTIMLTSLLPAIESTLDTVQQIIGGAAKTLERWFTSIEDQRKKMLEKERRDTIDAIAATQADVAKEYNISVKRLNELGSMSFKAFQQEAKGRGDATEEELRKMWHRMRVHTDRVIRKEWDDLGEEALKLNTSLAQGVEKVGKAGKFASGSMGALRAELSRQREILENRLIPGTQAWHDQLTKVMMLESDIDRMTERMAFFAGKGDAGKIALQGMSEVVEELGRNLSLAIDPMGRIIDSMTELEVTPLDWNRIWGEEALKSAEAALESYGETMLAVGGIMGSAVFENEGMKSALRQSLNLLIDYAQKQLLVASAVAALQTVFGNIGGLIALGGAISLLEIARAGVNSFDRGSPYISHDQLAKLHKGERVMTAAENAAMAKSQGAVSQGSQVGPGNTTQQVVTIRPEQFEYNIDHYHTSEARRRG